MVPRFLSISKVGCLAACLAGCLLATAAAEDGKPHLKKLHLAAKKENAVWTALQLEAYAREELGTKLTSILGRSTIYGSTVGAFPHNIQEFWDRGDHVDVIAGNTFYRLDGDLCPRDLQVRSPFDGGHYAFSPDRKRLGVSWKNRGQADAELTTYSGVRMRIGLFDADNGDVLIDRELPLPNSPYRNADRLNGDTVSALDGSVVAVGVARGGDENQSRVLIIGAEGDPRWQRKPP